MALKRTTSRAIRLTEPGWNDATRCALERLIRRGAGKGLPAVFDFDNTVVLGDIGEAVLAQLARRGRLVPGRIAEELCPPLRRPRGRPLGIRDCRAITEYYERFLAPTMHGTDDPTPLANGYVWAVQVMSGLRLGELVETSQEVLDLASQADFARIEPAPGIPGFPVPRLHPQMVELIGVLMEAGFVIWIVSASNVWSVRWMTLHALNPALAARGFDQQVTADHVIGVATLLQDGKGGLFKDAVLSCQRPRHLRLEDSATLKLRLTSQLQFPVPAYAGKVACIFDQIGQRPYLCAGDGPGDLAMLQWSEHRLWIARQSGSGRQARLRLPPTGGDWLLQLVREGPGGGFDSEPLTHALPPG